MNIKKIWKRIVLVAVILYVIWTGYVVWEGFLSCYIPWTRTFFVSFESYNKFLRKNHSAWDSDYFMDELPDGSDRVKYYWHENLGDKLSAYAVTLSDEAYENIRENRINAYCEVMAEKPELMVYKAEGEDVLYIEDTDWYDDERLHYIDKLIKKPGKEHQYYFATIVAFDNCHVAVLLNDNTKEMIEICAELQHDGNPQIDRLFWRYGDFLEKTVGTSYCQELPESAHDTEYYNYRELGIDKSGYRAAFSEEDYATVKQERMKYYETSTFDNQYSSESVGERYVYSENDKQYLNSIDLREKRIDYLDVLLTEEESENFYIGCSRFKNREELLQTPILRYRHRCLSKHALPAGGFSDCRRH